ncbi:MAG: CDP-diacylglycerol--glycerol-3-phosphate 3-phosphatidyltransferase [Elusimicrobiota bacterium]
MNKANKLTLLRIILVPVFMTFMFYDNVYTRFFALFIFIFASLTDLYDGKLARRYQTITTFGQFMDPLADKLLVSAAFISFIELQELFVPAWMVVFIISREFIITGLRSIAASKGIIIPADKGGKFKTTSQMIAIHTILVILIVNAVIFKFWQIRPEALLIYSGWKGWIGEILIKAPYWLMFITTVLTVISGVGYIVKHKKIFLEDIR